MANKDTNLAKPLKIGNRVAKNRFCIQPMECCDSQENGVYTDKTIQRYGDFFMGQAGLVVMESVTMQEESRARKDQLWFNIKDAENRKAWADFVKIMKDKNPDTLFIVQLNHSGEVSASSFSERVCVKPLEGFGGRVIDEDYVDMTLDSFVDTSKFLYDIGCDGVDVKFCHGYFGAQVLRPYNDRKWKYGGSWENRSRYAFDMIERIRKDVPSHDFLVGSKITMFENIPGGQGHAGPDDPTIDLTESIDLIKGCEERGCDYFIETLGGPSTTWELMSPNKHTADDVYMHMTCAKIMKQNLKPETAVVTGGLSILAEGKYNQLRAVAPEWNNLFHWGNFLVEKNYSDMIAIGRQCLADPYLPKKYLEDKTEDIKWCICCDGCGELMIRQSYVGCVVHNPFYKARAQELRKSQGRLGRIVTGDE